ncbi:MAG TPA: ECF-type sigma factor [Saprospiraceae bacterium]|nr:ECF-type sigma factor [Saprospiraceae bacterium]HMQ85700.1 ECF-type sigma factor [Saprospiraceae bacterium]
MPENESTHSNGLAELYPQAYEQLKLMARRQLAQEMGVHTLNTTDLVHEVYIKMAAQYKQDFENRAQFYALAAQAMRRLLIDYAREKKRDKRGGDKLILTLGAADKIETSAEELISLNDAVEQYFTLSQRGAQIIELWFFAGFRQEEIAEILDISVATVRREWTLARAWLSREIKRQQKHL